MSDRALRDLKRRAETDSRACLELAQALERLVRPGAALEALWCGCGDLDVRRATSRFDCGRGPVRDGRLLWQTKLDGRDVVEASLAASPLALTLGSAQRTVVLDPRTGERRCGLPPGEVRMMGEVIVVACASSDAIVAADAWTGERLHELSVPRTVPILSPVQVAGLVKPRPDAD